MINIEYIRSLATAATQGTRVHDWNNSEQFSQGTVRDITGQLIAIVAGTNHGLWRDADDWGESEFKANGDLIAALDPATVLQLIDELVTLRGIVAQGNVAYAGH